MIKDPTIRLIHIISSMESIERFLQGVTREMFLASDIKQGATVRKLEVIGIATKRISEEFKKQHLDIPWKDLEMDVVLAHPYFEIDYSEVWETASQQIPPLKEKIQHILDTLVVK